MCVINALVLKYFARLKYSNIIRFALAQIFRMHWKHTFMWTYVWTIWDLASHLKCFLSLQKVHELHFRQYIKGYRISFFFHVRLLNWLNSRIHKERTFIHQKTQHKQKEKRVAHNRNRNRVLIKIFYKKNKLLRNVSNFRHRRG